jgi:putative glutamine amidotransferase
MHLPVAVVASHLRAGRIKGWQAGAYAVADSYVKALRRVGLTPFVVAPGDRSSAADLLSGVRGLFLTGGSDIAATLYGAIPDPRSHSIDPQRDELEVSLVRSAVEGRVPTLGVCRGAQVINVALGGTLIQHLPDDPRYGAHGKPGGEAVITSVRVLAGTRLWRACGRGPLNASCHHHQGLDLLGSGLVAAAYAADGAIEAIEGRDGWLLAVQWHPEDTMESDQAQVRVLSSFAEAVKSSR